MRTSVLLLFMATRCLAQQMVTPTPDQAGTSRGENWLGYNLTDSFETGYRFDLTGGNSATYQSTVNYGDGFRLFDGFLDVVSQKGQGRFFDELLINASGLADPYMSASLRARKNKLYDYRLGWRRTQYFNPGLLSTVPQAEHAENTDYALQDHDLIVFPDSWAQFSFGYTRNTESGSAVTTIQSLDGSADVAPVFGNVRWLSREFRVGNELRWRGFVLNWMHGWEDFRDDSAVTGVATGDTLLSAFSRTQPDHGTSPWWRASLFRDTGRLRFNGRFTNTNGARAFALNENAVAGGPAPPTRQVYTLGNARRPVTTGNGTVSILTNERLNITTHASYYNVTTDGNSALLQFDNATQAASALYFQSLGIRTMGIDTTIDYRVSSWLDLYSGYEYSDRRIDSVEQFQSGSTFSLAPYSQTNLLNTASAGFRLRPLRGLTLNFDGELGHANLPFTPKSEKNYAGTNARALYSMKRFRFSGAATTSYNANSVLLSAFSSRERNYSGTASWTPSQWFSFDASYSKMHLDTVGGIAFFASGAQDISQSYYISNLHTATLGVRFEAWKRADLYLGYSRVQDTGDGRASATSTTTGPAIAGFQAAQTYPLVYQSPMARLSVRISPAIRWNVGYQSFGYHANFALFEDYVAHTGYTSLTWSF